ncbi:hypothetical protein L6R52_28540, partial [Myxococcota bacterium]|nr:hypothetical protein [Myxococcota bacterium]
EAITAADDGIRLLPDVIDLWQARMEVALGAGRGDDVVRTARTLAARFPDGAYALLTVARVLRRVPGAAERDELEALHRRALELNAGLFDALDAYVDHLCDHAAFERARSELETRLPAYEDAALVRRKLAEVLRREGRRAEALRALADLIRDRPEDVRTWQLAFTWIDEDEAYGLARELFERLRAVSVEHAHLHCERLLLLERAGMPAAELDQQWGRLLANFPTSPVVNLLRVDQLDRGGRHDEAATVLGAFARNDPRSPHVVARLARAEARSGRVARAIEHARTLFTMPSTNAGAAVVLVVEALDAIGHYVPLLELCVELISARARVSSQALTLVAGHARRREHLERLLEPLLGAADGAALSRPLSIVLDLLSERVAAHHPAMELVKRQPARVKEDVDLWATIGAVHTRRGDPAAAKAWLAGWRERRGVEMWAIVYYVRACWELDARDEAVRACVDALEQLGHDASVVEVVERLLVLDAWQDARRAFAEHLGRYRAILSRADGSSSYRAWIEVFERALDVDRGAPATKLAIRVEELDAMDRSPLGPIVTRWIAPKLTFVGWVAVWGARLWYRFVHDGSKSLWDLMKARRARP